MNEVMTQTEAAAFLRCEEEALEQRVLAGEIVYVDDGEQIMFLREDLLDYLRSQRTRCGVTVDSAENLRSSHKGSFQPLEVMNEREAAKFIRRSPSKLKKMRLNGEVPHLPGKPVTYLRTGLLAHFQSIEIAPNLRHVFPANVDSYPDDGVPETPSMPLPRVPRPNTKSNRETYREALDL